MFHWLAHVLGLDNASGHWYLWWSGSEPDLQSLLEKTGVVVVLVHQLNCHEPGCWRFGRFFTVETSGEHVRRCRRHHRARHTPTP